MGIGRRLGSSWGGLEVVWGGLGAVLSRSRAALEQSWGSLGSLGRSWSGLKRS